MRNAHFADFVRIPVKAFIWDFTLFPVIDEDYTHIIKVNVPLQCKHIEELLAYAPRLFVVGDNQIKTSRINLSLLSFHKDDSASAVHIVFRQ